MNRIFLASLAMAITLSPSIARAQSQPYQTPSYPQSGTITTGGTFQLWLSAASSRLGCNIENPTTATEPLYVFVIAKTQTIANAATGSSYSVAPGGYWNCAPYGIVITDAIAIDAATTGHAYVGNSQ